MPVNARTCKHLKSLLGEKYEIARLKFKNPNGPPPKGSSSKKVVSKSKPAQSKPASKRKKDDDGDPAEDREDGKPSKKPRSKPPSSKGRAKDDVAEEDENDEDGDDDEEEVAASNKTVPELLLANKWDIESGLDPAGWWISEKLDGVRWAHFSLVALRNSHLPVEPTTMANK